MAAVPSVDEALLEDEPRWRTRLRRWGPPLAILGILAASLETIRQERFGYRDILGAVHLVPAARIGMAVLLTALAYPVLIGYDALSLRYAGRRLRLRQTALASFIAYGLSQTLGFPLLTGGSVRARLWSSWGLSSEESFGGLLFERGEHFYNFQGLRQYKEKFDPEWHPRYLASPGGLALPRILTNIVTLISGGLRGVVVR